MPATVFGHLIPTSNPYALWGYYLGVFSILCGPVLGTAAVVCGVIGLRRCNRQPGLPGRAHAWTAIVLGTLTFFGTIALFLVVSRIR